jgi:hypothetical protein
VVISTRGITTRPIGPSNHYVYQRVRVFLRRRHNVSSLAFVLSHGLHGSERGGVNFIRCAARLVLRLTHSSGSLAFAHVLDLTTRCAAGSIHNGNRSTSSINLVHLRVSSSASFVAFVSAEMKPFCRPSLSIQDAISISRSVSALFFRRIWCFQAACFRLGGSCDLTSWSQAGGLPPLRAVASLDASEHQNSGALVSFGTMMFT